MNFLGPLFGPVRPGMADYSRQRDHQGVTLAQLRDEFNRGAIREADLRNPFEHIDGLCDFGSKRVYVNPRPAIVETLLHELIHRRYPAWSERRVDRAAKGLFARMTTRQVNSWYRRYQDSVTRHKQPKRVEDE